MGDAMNDTQAISMAALWSSIHMLRIMTNRGFVSPAEVETVYSSIVESFETFGSPELAAKTTARLDGIMCEIREYANDRWIGKGQSDPA